MRSDQTGMKIGDVIWNSWKRASEFLDFGFWNSTVSDYLQSVVFVAMGATSVLQKKTSIGLVITELIMSALFSNVGKYETKETLEKSVSPDRSPQWWILKTNYLTSFAF